MQNENNNDLEWSSRLKAWVIQGATFNPRALLSVAILLLLATALVVAYAFAGYGTYLEREIITFGPLIALIYPVFRDFICFAMVYVWCTWRFKFTRVFSAVALAIFLLLQLIQLQSILLTTEYLTPELVLMVTLLIHSINLEAVLMLLGLITVVTGISWFNTKVIKLHEQSWLTRILTTLILGALLLGGKKLPTYDDKLEALEQKYGIKSGSPMVASYDTVKVLVNKEAKHVAEPSEKEISQALSFGMHINPKRYLPLKKNFIYENPLPFKEKKPIGKPNVIVFFIESLNAAVLEPYGSRHKGLTPNLVEFDKHAMRVDGYINHTAPTICGLRGQLCSLFPAYHYNDWKKATTKLKTSPLLCMPHILNDRGYDTVYLSHGAPDVVYTESQFIDFGFQSLQWGDDVAKLIDEEPAARGEPDDRQMFMATRKWLEQRDSAKPFFLNVSTIETHVGRNVASGEKKYSNGRYRVLNVFHRMDHFFGEFWRWFKDSKYAENTILVVTGDHTQPPNKYMRMVAEDWYLNTQFSYMGLFIYDPFHELPDSIRPNTSSIDFAPSILQLIGVENQPNPFLGLSMFSDRDDKQGGAGLIYAKRYFYWKDDKPVIKLFGCKKKDNCPAYNAAKWLAYLDRGGRIWSR